MAVHGDPLKETSEDHMMGYSQVEQVFKTMSYYIETPNCQAIQQIKISGHEFKVMGSVVNRLNSLAMGPNWYRKFNIKFSHYSKMLFTMNRVMGVAPDVSNQLAFQQARTL